MNINSEDIANAICCEKELARMLSLIKDISIIEYDGANIDGSCAIAQYMKENNIETSFVSRIVLLGRKIYKNSANAGLMAELFPNAKVSIVNKLWYEINPQSLKIRNTLVIHNGITAGITDHMFDMKSGMGAHFVNFVNKTRVAYYACLLYFRNASLFDNPYVLRLNLRLKDFVFETEADVKPQTNFCKEKQDYILNCIKHLTAKDAFFQCIDETEHGCEECGQCENYGTRRKCPFAQRIVAHYYRKGIYVPQDEKIAHQWELMAARQNYKPARIQVADDLKDGCGCKKDVNAALDIYSLYAYQIGNNHCIEKILDIAEDCIDYNQTIAIPFIAQQAQDGNEDMVIKLSGAFQNSKYGLPKDMVQQKEWIQQGADNGNPRFVLAMAEMYEANAEWHDAYNWYKTLEKVAPQLLNEEKLEEIELKMLTNGFSSEDVAISGQNYLFGYFGIERDLHLAFRCLKYASDNDIALAKGLLGLMYLEGWEVSEDVDTAIELLNLAAEAGDLFSMDKLTDLHYAEEYDYCDGKRWEDIIIERIEDRIARNNSYAYYLKGYYQSIGYQYEEDDYAAFVNMKEAAERGVPKAQYKLYEMYSLGIGVGNDSTTANKWLKIAATNGYYEAEGVYGMQLYERPGLFNNLSKRNSFSYLKQAYEKGYEEAYWCLAQCYMNGIGTDINKELAYPLYQQAAENGIAKAQEFLCENYFRGDNPLPKDYTLCAKWGEEAIKQGCKGVRFETAYSSSQIGIHDRAKELYLELSSEGNAAAMNNYACELSDYKEKAEWFLKSANHGDDYGMWNIAKYYRNGTGVEKDIERALELFKQSANKGNKGAMKDLAHMYRYGDGVEKDGIIAIEWYKKAADKDDVDAILALGEIYSEGKLVCQDIGQSAHYYKMAAEKDNSTALLKLGELYEFGTGVEQNTHKAIYWYRKAAINGNNQAKESLKRLNSNWLDANGLVDDSLDIDEDLLPF